MQKFAVIQLFDAFYHAKNGDGRKTGIFLALWVFKIYSKHIIINNRFVNYPPPPPLFAGKNGRKRETYYIHEFITWEGA